MNQIQQRSVALATLLLSLMLSFNASADRIFISDEARAYVKDRYIFVFKDKVTKRDVRSQARNLVRASGGKLGHIYSNSIRGFSAKMPAAAAAKVASKNPNIAYYEKDSIVLAVAKGGNGGKGGGKGKKPPKDEESTPPAEDDPTPPPPPPPPPPPCDPQSVPPGISTVGGPGSSPIDPTVKAWVIDSGIDLDHPDLNVDVDSSRSFLGGSQSSNPDDQHGHGTHVAGTIAAIDDECGVVGVAPGAPVVSVRVLDQYGGGSWSGVIAGIDYVAGNGDFGDVANVSLGGAFNQAVNDAVVAASSKVKFAIAAGNNGVHAGNSSPASASGPNIYTVSAVNFSGQFAGFSNYGNPPVHCAAPGVSIYSTYKNGGYATWSGTSMSAPHVAGILLQGVMGYDTEVASNDPDPVPDPLCIIFGS